MVLVYRGLESVFCTFTFSRRNHSDSFCAEYVENPCYDLARVIVLRMCFYRTYVCMCVRMIGWLILDEVKQNLTSFERMVYDA